MVRSKRPIRPPARGGFTLIELVVVLGIILLLVSLSVGAVMKLVVFQQRRNTEQVILKVDKALQQQWKEVVTQAKTEVPNPIAVYLANGDSRRAQVIHILMCLRREFPNSFQEATQTISLNNVGNFGPNAAYVRALQNYNAGNNWGGRTPEDQSSACLYLTLKQRRGGVTFDPDISLAAGQELVDPVSDGVKEIIDNFSSRNNAAFQPIIFNRWPCNVGAGVAVYGSGVGVNSSSPAFGVIQPFTPSTPADPQDPEALLANAGWLTWLQTTTFNPGNIPNVNVFNTCVGYPSLGVNLPGINQQYKMTPVIISLGANGKYDGSNPGADDIINFQLGAGRDQQLSDTCALTTDRRCRPAPRSRSWS